RHYLDSLAQSETFMAMCNLARAEADLALYAAAYEHVRMCIFLHSRDDEFESIRRKIYKLREVVRIQISFEEAHRIDARVDKEIDRRLEAEELPAVSTVPEPAESHPLAATAPAAEERISSARAPVSVALGVTGLAGVGVGVGLFVASGNQKNEAMALRDELTDNKLSCD